MAETWHEQNYKKPTPRKTYRKVITSPELTEQINPLNKRFVEKYLRNFATKRSPKSCNVYRSNFNIFFTWNLLYNDNVSFVDIKKIEMQDFFDFCLTELKWSPNRYAQMHSSLSELSKYVEKFYDVDYPKFRNLLVFIEKIPKKTVRKKSVFKKDELDGLMRWLGENGRVNEQCLLALIMASGSRASELVRFRTSLIDYNHTAFEGLFLETTEEIRVKGHGTDGNYVFRYIIKDMFVPYYEKYLPLRNFIVKKYGKDHDYLFVKRNGDPATVATIRSWMKHWDNFLSQHWYPHAGRHFWTSYLSSLGIEKELIQELQSWSSSDLVDVYNDNTAKDKKWKNLDKLAEALKDD